MLNFLINCCVIFFLILSDSHADWEYISSTENVNFYIDRETIERANTYGSVWELQNFPSKVDSEQGSFRYYSQYDCDKRMWMYTFFSRHNGQMATGEITLQIATPSKWRAIPPNTPASSIFKTVCN